LRNVIAVFPAICFLTTSPKKYPSSAASIKTRHRWLRLGDCGKTLKRKIFLVGWKEISGFAESVFRPPLRAAALLFPEFVPIQSGSSATFLHRASSGNKNRAERRQKGAQQVAVGTFVKYPGQEATSSNEYGAVAK